jgi:pyruvate/2-oxoglutarate dehydrogenase complex dihydrolipoamide dehydrogenase (E3) component
MIGLGETGCLTPFELWQMKSLDSLPERIAIAGNTPMAIQLAQILQRLGKKITLLFDTPSLLPQADFDIASLLQVQLEAEGICLVPQSQVSQVRRIDGKKWILAGKQAWELDELILATATQGNTEGLNLSAVGVEVTTQGLKVKKTLQTTNPRIYGIGNVISGESSPNLARQMATIAVKNALFLPIYKMEDQGIPQILFTDPPIASIGINEQRARQLYGQDFQVLKMPFKFNLKAQILGEITGFCKLIIDRSDSIIGADIIGYQAEELIQIISLVINQKLPLGTLTNLPSLGTFAEIIAQTARQKPQKYHFHKKWLTSWLMWQRQRY